MFLYNVKCCVMFFVYTQSVPGVYRHVKGDFSLLFTFITTLLRNKTKTKQRDMFVYAIVCFMDTNKVTTFNPESPHLIIMK